MDVTAQWYRQLIIAGIQDLPPDLLAEIVDFVDHLRKHSTNPDTFSAESYSLLVEQELLHLSMHEAAHLEIEFADYQQRFALECVE